jgi:tRNA nucleotidyltransferase (CCA-adding enzyme)
MEKLREIHHHLRSLGADVYLVGGAVRDFYLGYTPKDLDSEVYKLTMAELVEALLPFGEPKLVGKCFGVVKLDNYDFSLPRKEYKTDVGHKGFEVQFDPKMSLEEASSRRDFTMNSMVMDLETREIIDFFGGKRDLARGILRHTSVAFKEDPLRVMRGFQFCARFNLSADNSTIEVCRVLASEYHSLSVERIWEEWKKWAKGSKRSLGLEFLRQTGWLEFYPELRMMIGTSQHPEFHPEGDVWEHTKLALDFLARDAELEVVFAVLLHDAGKALVNDEGPKHNQISADMVFPFMDSIGCNQPKTIDIITKLVLNHDFLLPNRDKLGKASVRRLAVRLEPATIGQLCQVSEADGMGTRNHKQADDLREVARELEVEANKPKPILMGRHLLEMGMKPGPKMGEALAEIYAQQLSGDIESLEEAKSRILRLGLLTDV